MKKTTEELLEKLRKTHAPPLVLRESGGHGASVSLSQHLNLLLEQRGLKKASIIKNAGLTAAYGYKIFSGERTPHREKVIALCFGFALDTEQAQRLLCTAGFAPLFPSLFRERIILFALKEQADLITCNELLYEFGEPLIQ